MMAASMTSPRRTLAAATWLLATATGVCAEPPASDPAGWPALVRAGEAADARLDPGRALQFYLQANAEHPNDPAILLKVAKAYSDSTLADADRDENRRRMAAALECSRRAAQLKPHDPVALLSVAVSYGKLGIYCDTGEKIKYARLVKDYAEQALAADPNYAYAHHVLGQWEYEVASLGRTKRFLVSIFYGGLPAASAAEGVRELERAVQLEPDTTSHHLALGFAYLANGECAKGRQCFERVLAMPCRELYDPDCHRQAEQALAGL